MSDEIFGGASGQPTALLENYVAVMYAESDGEADYFRTMLENNGIPAVIEGADARRRSSAGISVLVPAARLDEASDLVVANDAGDSTAWEDEVKDDTDSDDDVFEEDEDDDLDDDEDEDEDDDDDDAFDDDDDEEDFDDDA